LSLPGLSRQFKITAGALFSPAVIMDARDKPVPDPDPGCGHDMKVWVYENWYYLISLTMVTNSGPIGLPNSSSCSLNVSVEVPLSFTEFAMIWLAIESLAEFPEISSEALGR
jgi:hypothetical protein